MKITCLVDNSVQAGSTFWGEHGLSFLIEAQGKHLLFDTGASGTVLVHNLQELNIQPGGMAALALSHAHYDHTGGLRAFLEIQPWLPLYAHPDLLRERFSRRPQKVKSVGLRLAEGTLSRLTDLRLSVAAQQILPGVWTTGEIAERLEPEGRSPYHVVRQGEGWSPDPYRDDMALVLEAPAGLALVCGCCHAGLLNTLAHVRRAFGQHPIAVIGGTHLVSAEADHMRRLVELLAGLGPPALYLNHCTGQAAYVALAQAFGKRVAPCPAGTVLEF